MAVAIAIRRGWVFRLVLLGAGAGFAFVSYLTFAPTSPVP
jgi:hypothetical protein